MLISLSTNSKSNADSEIIQFILNMRRSGGLAEAIPVTVKFGTSLEQIDELRRRLLEFVKAEKREYQSNILTEVRDVIQVQSVNLNVIFFYKSNWQNELLRLQRRNKFICAMMVSMQEIGIEGPQQRIAGQQEENPFYYAAAASKPPFEQADLGSDQGPGPQSGSLARRTPSLRQQGSHSILREGSIASRKRGESISQMSRRYDFNREASDVMGEVYSQSPARPPPEIRRTSASRTRIAEEKAEFDDEQRIAKVERNETSRPSRFRSLHRTSTDTQQLRLRTGGNSVHRNRFFPRRGQRDSLDGADQDLMEQGMADIPESRNSVVRMDPRSGALGSQAVRMDTNTSYAGSQHSLQSGKPVTGAGALEEGGFGAPERARTETYEMRRMDG